MIYNHPIGSIYHLYTTYILPIGLLYATYHLLREPGNSVEDSPSLFFKKNGFFWFKTIPAWSLGKDRILAGRKNIICRLVIIVAPISALDEQPPPYWRPAVQRAATAPRSVAGHHVSWFYGYLHGTSRGANFRSAIRLAQISGATWIRENVGSCFEAFIVAKKKGSFAWKEAVIAQSHNLDIQSFPKFAYHPTSISLLWARSWEFFRFFWSWTPMFRQLAEPCYQELHQCHLSKQAYPPARDFRKELHLCPTDTPPSLAV